MKRSSRVLLCLLFAFGFACKDPDVLKKMDENLKAELKRLSDAKQLDRQISIVIRTNEALTDTHLEVLKREGVEVSANIGNIYTITLPAKNLRGVARLKFIDFLQGQKTFRTSPPQSNSSTR